ncbi:MAG: hypothetical protein GC185_06615 [Alphaproteobacteria bacterium]|nr:hypothetical protein [Alphaproteobacteria bacterium]
MQLKMEAFPAELPAVLSRFLSIVGMGKLKPRLDEIERHLNDTGWKVYAEDRLGLEVALLKTINYKKTTSRVQWPPRTPDHYRLYSFMFSIVSVYHHLSEKGKKRLSGYLNSCLDQEDGFGPLAFEMRFASFLMSSGFDVTFSDLEGIENFDFLACKGEYSIEVECKFVSQDIGRKIHQRKFHQLSEYLKPVLDEVIQVAKDGTLIKLELKDRLTANLEQLSPMREGIKEILKTGKETHTDSFSITMRKFSISDVPLSQGRQSSLVENLREFVKKNLDLENSNILLRAELASDAAIVIAVKSRKPDLVLERIYTKHLKAAADQLTGKRLGIACMHFADLSEEQLHIVAGGRSGLTETVYKTLKRRPRLYGIAVMVNGTVSEKRSSLLYAPAVTTESGPLYTFTNPFSSVDKHEEGLFGKIFNA